MSWQEGVAVIVIVVGLAAGAFLVSQRPAFWIEFGARLVKALLPGAVAYISKRMTPEQEKAFQDCARRGGQWDSIRKRCRD